VTNIEFHLIPKKTLSEINGVSHPQNIPGRVIDLMPWERPLGEEAKKHAFSCFDIYQIVTAAEA